MTKRLIGTIAAAAVFITGMLLLVGYVRSAEQQVVADEELVDVLVLSQPVEAGDDPAASVRVEQIPARLVSSETVRRGDSLNGLVANADLVAGEQLLWARLDAPEEISVEGPTRIPIPDEFVAVTIPVGPERALGGLLQPGMTVAVVGSFQLDGAVADEDATGVEATNVLAHKVLVVEVQADEPLAMESPGLDLAAATPSGGFLVTLAAPVYDVERIIFAAEWGSIWLAQQGEGASEEGSQIQTADTIFEQLDGDLSIRTEDEPDLLAESDEGTTSP